MSYYSKNSFEKPTGKLRLFKSSKVFVVLLIMAFGFSLCSYLLQINDISEKGYKIKDIEKQISMIKDENEKLSIKLVDLQSMKDLNAKVMTLGMVSVNEIEFISSSAYLARK